MKKALIQNLQKVKEVKMTQLMESTLELLEISSEKVLITGSFAILKGESNADIDIMFYMKDLKEEFINELLEDWDKNASYLILTAGVSTAENFCGFKKEDNPNKLLKGEEYNLWGTYRKSIFNVLITTKEDYFNKWVECTKLATEMKVTSKMNRRLLFSEVCGD